MSIFFPCIRCFFKEFFLEIFISDMLSGKTHMGKDGIPEMGFKSSKGYPSVFCPVDIISW